MKPHEIRDMTRDEIFARKVELEKEMFNLRIRQGYKQIDNPLRMRVLRRELARITTILHEDENNIRPLISADRPATGGDIKND
jgi:large subunit ribosomal protein L29